MARLLPLALGTFMTDLGLLARRLNKTTGKNGKECKQKNR